MLPTRGETRILIQPGYRFRVVDALLTNFHLAPLDAARAGVRVRGAERMLEAYRQAILRGYRFFSYGDAMLIPTERAFMSAPGFGFRTLAEDGNARARGDDDPQG